MKQERDLVVVACPPSPFAANSASSRPTPSPFSGSARPTPSPPFSSVGSTRRSSRPSVHVLGLVLRFMATIFSFISALSLAVSPEKQPRNEGAGFNQHPELLYCFIVASATFVYSTFQLLKGICDFAHRGIIVSDMASDYISFVLDQTAGYLLISSSSAAIPATQRLDTTTKLWKSAVVSTSMLFACFIVMALCGLFSGYKLYKRIDWL